MTKYITYSMNIKKLLLIVMIERYIFLECHIQLNLVKLRQSSSMMNYDIQYLSTL